MAKTRETHTAAAVYQLRPDVGRVVPGRILLVGAGPGDPDLLTVKAVKAIQAADTIVYDKLVGAEILALARPDAELIYVGKSRASHTLPQEEICQILVEHARSGAVVVRLKGGDPFIFGRGGEEVAAARAANVEIEVVPGITAALGCAADAQLPLTHRDHASAVTFVAGQCKDLHQQDWRGLHGAKRTLVIYMGLNGAAYIADKLLGEGAHPALPVAIIENGTRKNKRVIQADLASLAQVVTKCHVGSPALLVVGDVAALAQQSSIALDDILPAHLAYAAE